MTEPLLQVNNLVRHFRREGAGFVGRAERVRAVDGVSFELHTGKTLGLVGESGCGKTSAGRVVLGLDQPTSGSVHFEGRSMSGLAPVAWRALRREMQMIFQDPLGALDPRVTLGRQIMEPLEIHGVCDARERERHMRVMLDAVGLPEEIAGRYPHEISGGQQQRVVVARALILNPKLVVCDEPVSALDVSVQAQVINLLARLQREFSVAYLFISHDLKVVRHLSHQVAVMYLGQIVELADRDELFDRPLHPYTQALIAAIPVLDPARRRKRILLHGDPPSPVNPPAGCRFHTRCPLAEPICREKAPRLEQISARHSAACHVTLRQAAGSRETEH